MNIRSSTPVAGVSRARFVGIASGAIGAAAFVRTPGQAAQFEFKCGSNAPLDHPVVVYATLMFKDLERLSGGRISVQFFPNSLLGNDASMFTQMRAGAIQLFIISAGNLASVVPVADISNLGFLYSDFDEALRVMNGPVGSYVRAEALAKGIYIFKSQWGSGLRELASIAHPIKTPEDLHGFKVREDGKVAIDLFKALGASPISLSANEQYTALQTKLLDGMDVPLASMEGFHAYEVTKYLSLTHHIYSGVWLSANLDAWKSLPPDLQDLFERVNTRYVGLGFHAAKTLANALADKLVGQGMSITRIVDQAPFRKLLGTYYTSWQSAFGPAVWGMLQTSLNRRVG